jgi:hypothetical protein
MKESYKENVFIFINNLIEYIRPCEEMEEFIVKRLFNQIETELYECDVKSTYSIKLLDCIESTLDRYKDLIDDFTSFFDYKCLFRF